RRDAIRGRRIYWNAARLTRRPPPGKTGLFAVTYALCATPIFAIGHFSVTSALHQSSIKSLPLLGRGKVRDMYAVGDDKLLIVASDRISAFDVILDDPIPGKGQVLTELTEFWLQKLAHIL
uniref:phosphoribosylaminoimidazolesuccinocarboxamide synthase n=1 Tax=Escherichia coli TaxID=562 RepID=UPI0027D2A76B